ncbi:O-antigen ligase family protein [Novosphingobium sp. H3SJ31-1]|uniref:O-antigen ligase family protein n=1 Tax=Novosphingobium album (ex Liu et al. 2023) TaxID=3031130 RepID=A0ABT5WTI4_9SPHN|nr:O-antigen ligase family protein [Novosphingobium album (ex Liu et al. 2023)]
MVVPVLQLVPVPQAIWHLAPQSEHWLAVQSFTGPLRWRPISLHPEMTVGALIDTLSFVALLLAGIQLNIDERVKTIDAVIAIAFGSVLLGVLQGQLGLRQLYLQADAVPGTITGFFGNRNHQADFLVIATGLCATRIQTGRPIGHNVMTGALCLLFAAAAITTHSRSALVLLVILAVAMSVIRLRSRLGALLVSGSILVALIGLSVSNSVVTDVLARFSGDTIKLSRLTIWAQSQIAVRQTFPLGSGIGTFREFYESIEPLDLVGPTFVNHAHNDALQVIVEAGLLGLASLALVAGAIGWLAWKALARRNDTMAHGAAICLCVPMLHSLVDYPLRTMAISSLVAVMIGLLCPPPAPSGNDAGAGATDSGDPTTAAVQPRRWGVSLVIALTGLFCMSFELARMLLAAGAPSAAVALAPYSANAHLALADSATNQGEADIALLEASRALRRNALSSEALSLIGLVEYSRQHRQAADKAFLAAAHLGWRNPSVLGYMFGRAIETGSATTAAQMADARLRLEIDRDEVLGATSALLADETFRNAFAERFKNPAPWQTDFVAALRPASPLEAEIELLFLARLQAISLSAATLDRLSTTYMDGLVRSGQTGDLEAGWKNLHPAGGDPAAGVLDPNFSHVDGASYPFGWQIEPAVARIGNAPREPSPALRIANYTGEKVLAASQFLLLGPGIYHLSYRTRPGTDDDPDLTVTMRCVAGGAIRLHDESEPASDETTRFVIRSFMIGDKGCEAQRVLVSIDAMRENRPLYISDFSITSH